MSAPASLPDILTPGELMQKLGLKKSQFHALQKAGHFDHLKVKRPFGWHRYSRVLVDRFVAGESTSQYGHRRV